ncbi:MAG: NADP-dependent isocitrate dehydrogenase, partial [Ghiorsea sp.]|nr:NADP-dependent isocitrate dehydrogenase [Ghiorsea sp.]
MPSKHTIIYTKTDEAPMLATASFLPIVQAFTKTAGVRVISKDISLAGRILAQFPDYLEPEQQQSDALAELGALAKMPEANVIKLPNISASVPQLEAAIAELQAQCFNVPNYPAQINTDKDKGIQSRYAKVLGSAVNPVLREGNSDRRVAAAVKQYAKDNPHSMGEWSADSKSHVAHMDDGDFYGSEQSVVLSQADTLSIILETEAEQVLTLKEGLSVESGEIVDAAVMSKKALRAFYAAQIEEMKGQDAKAQGVLLSLHLKATMMKVSDPIMFGHAVEVYFKDVFEKYADTFAQLGVNTKNGLGDVYAKIADLPDAEREAIEADIEAVYAINPDLAMVDS